MSRRTAKKRLKKINATQTAGNTAAAETVSAEPSDTLSTPVPETETQASSSNAPADTAAPAETVSAAAKAPAYEMFLQYQNCEFTVDNIARRILDKCAADQMDCGDLKIYVKPEDGKAYYVCAGGNSFIEL